MKAKFALWIKHSETPAAKTAKALAKAHLDFHKRHGSEILKFSTCHEKFTEIFNNDGRVRTPKGLAKEHKHGCKALTYYLDSLAALEGKTDEPIYATFFSPFTVVLTSIGEAKTLAMLEKEPEAVVAAAQRVSEMQASLLDTLDRRGIGVFYANRVNKVKDYSPFIPIDRKLLKGRDGIYHIHGYSPSTKEIIKSSGMKYLSWESRAISLDDIGDKTPMGGIDRDLIRMGEYAKIEQEMRAVLKRPGAVIAPNCAIHPDITPPENIAKVAEMAKGILGIESALA